jgi:hypothetical protein
LKEERTETNRVCLGLLFLFPGSGRSPGDPGFNGFNPVQLSPDRNPAVKPSKQCPAISSSGTKTSLMNKHPNSADGVVGKRFLKVTHHPSHFFALLIHRERHRPEQRKLVLRLSLAGNVALARPGAGRRPGTGWSQSA